MERRPLKLGPRQILLIFAAAVVLVGGGLVASRMLGPRIDPLMGRLDIDAGPDERAPEGVRIRVEVLNATRVRGLARRATMHLRDRGFDVVEIGTASEQRDSTLVLDRSGHPEWAELVSKAMGGAAVEARPDTSRYLDITVLVGDSWRPPPEPFYP